MKVNREEQVTKFLSFINSWTWITNYFSPLAGGWPGGVRTLTRTGGEMRLSLALTPCPTYTTLCHQAGQSQTGPCPHWLTDRALHVCVLALCDLWPTVQFYKYYWVCLSLQSKGKASSYFPQKKSGLIQKSYFPRPPLHSGLVSENFLKVK